MRDDLQTETVPQIAVAELPVSQEANSASFVMLGAEGEKILSPEGKAYLFSKVHEEFKNADMLSTGSEQEVVQFQDQVAELKDAPGEFAGLAEEYVQEQAYERRREALIQFLEADEVTAPTLETFRRKQDNQIDKDKLNAFANSLLDVRSGSIEQTGKLIAEEKIVAPSKDDLERMDTLAKMRTAAVGGGHVPGPELDERQEFVELRNMPLTIDEIKDVETMEAVKMAAINATERLSSAEEGDISVENIINTVKVAGEEQLDYQSQPENLAAYQSVKLPSDFETWVEKYNHLLPTTEAKIINAAAIVNYTSGPAAEAAVLADKIRNAMPNVKQILQELLPDKFAGSGGGDGKSATDAETPIERPRGDKSHGAAGVVHDIEKRMSHDNISRADKSKSGEPEAMNTDTTEDINELKKSGLTPTEMHKTTEQATSGEPSSDIASPNPVGRSNADGSVSLDAYGMKTHFEHQLDRLHKNPNLPDGVTRTLANKYSADFNAIDAFNHGKGAGFDSDSFQNIHYAADIHNNPEGMFHERADGMQDTLTIGKLNELPQTMFDIIKASEHGHDLSDHQIWKIVNDSMSQQLGIEEIGGFKNDGKLDHCTATITYLEKPGADGVQHENVVQAEFSPDVTKGSESLNMQNSNIETVLVTVVTPDGIQFALVSGGSTGDIINPNVDAALSGHHMVDSHGRTVVSIDGSFFKPPVPEEKLEKEHPQKIVTPEKSVQVTEEATGHQTSHVTHTKEPSVKHEQDTVRGFKKVWNKIKTFLGNPGGEQRIKNGPHAGEEPGRASEWTQKPHTSEKMNVIVNEGEDPWGVEGASDGTNNVKGPKFKKETGKSKKPKKNK